jgi:periplasmic divalent cation tolerance protein
MEQNDKLVLVYTTFPSIEAATATGEKLVKRRLAACVNMIPNMTSIYEWDGQLQRDSEVVMIVKTRSSHAAAVTAAIKADHTYETPAVLVLPVDGGSEPYLAWLRAQTAVI